MNDFVLSRADLISLLSEACELEHGLACSYLYSAFSLKQSPLEKHLTTNEFILARKWAGQLYAIAAQEMMHFSQDWNLLSAIGGSPYYMRPNFPQNHKYYPIDLPLKTERFGEMALKRFIFYELPNHLSDSEYLQREFGITFERINSAFTVGKLYGMIRTGFETLNNKLGHDGLFIGNPDLQVGPEVCDFKEITKVVDIKSALKGIETVIEQGEGTGKGADVDQMDCHYGLFLEIEKEFRAAADLAKAEGRVFEPARNIIENPVTTFKADITPGANAIKDPYTNQVAVLFDNIYSLMLRVLQYVFQSGPLPNDRQKMLASTAIQIMTRVLKPLGEALNQLPFETGNSIGCGAAFGLYRNVSFPDDPAVADVLVSEGFKAAIKMAEELGEDPRAPIGLKSAHEKLSGIIRDTKIMKL